MDRKVPSLNSSFAGSYKVYGYSGECHRFLDVHVFLSRRRQERLYIFTNSTPPVVDSNSALVAGENTGLWFGREMVDIGLMERIEDLTHVKDM